MKKTIDDYLKEPALADEPTALREVHAIRLKLHDERKGMTAAEYNAIVHQRAVRFLSSEQGGDEGGGYQGLQTTPRHE
jgi:hypothetical protein